MEFKDNVSPNNTEDVISNLRNVDDYNFSDEENKSRFERSITVSEALPTVVKRIVTDIGEKGRALVWVIGAWGVGKTTFGKSLLEGLTDLATVYLDGDVYGDHESIYKAVEHGPAEGEVVLISASFIENWKFERQAQPPIIINLIADDSTRHGNFFFRAGGPRSQNFDVAKAIKHRQESPNYIIPNPDSIIVDSSEKCRVPPELISQQVKSLLAIERNSNLAQKIHSSSSALPPQFLNLIPQLGGFFKFHVLSGQVHLGLKVFNKTK